MIFYIKYILLHLIRFLTVVGFPLTPSHLFSDRFPLSLRHFPHLQLIFFHLCSRQHMNGRRHECSGYNLRRYRFWIVPKLLNCSSVQWAIVSLGFVLLHLSIDDRFSLSLAVPPSFKCIFDYLYIFLGIGRNKYMYALKSFL